MSGKRCIFAVSPQAGSRPEVANFRRPDLSNGPAVIGGCREIDRRQRPTLQVLLKVDLALASVAGCGIDVAHLISTVAVEPKSLGLINPMKRRDQPRTGTGVRLRTFWRQRGRTTEFGVTPPHPGESNRPSVPEQGADWPISSVMVDELSMLSLRPLPLFVT